MLAGDESNVSDSVVCSVEPSLAGFAQKRSQQACQIQSAFTWGLPSCISISLMLVCKERTLSEKVQSLCQGQKHFSELVLERALELQFEEKEMKKGCSLPHFSPPTLRKNNKQQREDG